MFGGLGDLMGLVKQAKSMQERMKTLQEELARKVYEADAGAGAVTARVSGKGDVLSIKIQPDAVKPGDVESLEEFVKAAVNAAVRKSQEAMQAEMSQMTAGMNLGGFANLLGGQTPTDG